VVWADGEGWPAQLERGVAEAAVQGEPRSGDRAVFVGWDGGALVAAIDGLGHGGDAADAAEEAAKVVGTHPREAPERLLQLCHEALVKTRGVVMTLAWFDLASATLTWTGVGNVEGRLMRATAPPGVAPESALIKGGVVGYSLPSVRPTSTQLHSGDLLVMATDGISSAFAGSLVAGVEAQELAERILAEHGRGTDDALVVVVRATLE
jgi:negative regulator of sigma-B (phosphoserine phosphatase)